jgi:hypothetical protein
MNATSIFPFPFPPPFLDQYIENGVFLSTKIKILLKYKINICQTYFLVYFLLQIRTLTSY